MKFSASQLKTWGRCSLQAKFQYIDKIDRWETGSAAHFGTSVHLALENYHNGKNEEECILIFRKYFDSIEPDRWDRRTSYTKYKDIGPKMIKNYIDVMKWETHKTLGVEYRFMVPFGDHILSGIIDHLHTDKQESVLFIDDLKTGAKPNLDTLHLDLQFTVYDYASTQKEFWTGAVSDDPEWPDKYPGLPNGEELFEKFQNLPRKNRWVDLRTTKFIDVGPRNDFDYARLYRMAEMIQRAVDTETYVPCISADSCYFCPYKPECPVYLNPIQDLK
jgi:hypothetical protein